MSGSVVPILHLCRRMSSMQASDGALRAEIDIALPQGLFPLAEQLEQKHNVCVASLDVVSPYLDCSHKSSPLSPLFTQRAKE